MCQEGRALRSNFRLLWRYIELRESFRLFAEGSDLRDEYGDANCASARTPEYANLILANLDSWAAWYETNG